MNTTFLIVLGVGAALALIIAYFSKRERKKRIEDLKVISNGLGFIFSAKAGSGFEEKIKDFYMYNREGSYPEVKNIMTGNKNGLQVSIFDFYYTIGDQKVSTRYSQTILLVECPDLNLPFFILRPESVLDKIGNLFGGQDIDFDANPDFSDHYLLRGEEENRIRETFSPAVISYYEQHHGVYTEGNKDKLLFFLEMGKDLIGPEKVPDLMNEGMKACQVFLQKDPSKVIPGGQ